MVWKKKISSHSLNRTLTDTEMVCCLQLYAASVKKRLRHQWEFDKCCVTPDSYGESAICAPETSFIDTRSDIDETIWQKSNFIS